jgi:hypothetical protein
MMFPKSFVEVYKSNEMAKLLDGSGQFSELQNGSDFVVVRFVGGRFVAMA